VAPEHSHIRQRAIEGIRTGDTFTCQRTFTVDDTLAFGELTRDANPVHYDEAFARGKGFSGPLLHGLLTGSMLCEIGGQMGWLATSMEFSFLRPVYDGDTITCRFTVTEVAPDGIKAHATVEYENQHGERVLEAKLRGHLPTAEQRQVMAKTAAPF
jgi:acyl dehydratase